MLKELLKITGTKNLSELSKKELLELQAALKELSLYNATIDGIYGNITAGAWQKFKSDNNQALPELIGPGSIELLKDLLALNVLKEKITKPVYKISDNGIHSLSNLEGKVNHVYLDSAGFPSIGIGHLIKPGERFTTLTDKQVYDLFRRDLIRFEKAINSLVKVKLTQNQYDALVSFAFNIGVGGFARSKTLKLLNQGNYKGAAVAFMGWIIPPEIIGRRQKEIDLFLKL